MNRTDSVSVTVRDAKGRPVQLRRSKKRSHKTKSKKKETKESAGEGLVEKDVTVHRDGKTFTERRMVKVGGAKAIDKMAVEEMDAKVKDYLESALHNIRKEDRDKPEEVAQQLSSMYEHAQKKGDEKAMDALALAMHHVGAEVSGPEVGDRTQLNPSLYASKTPAFTGDDVTVLRKPVMLGKKVIRKGLVTTKEAAKGPEAGDAADTLRGTLK